MLADNSLLSLAKSGIQRPQGAIEYLIPRSTLSGIELAIFSRRPLGANILQEDWDLLLVLDTCRLDALKEVQATSDYPWLNGLEISSQISVGGSTLEWTAQTFREDTRELVRDVDFIAGNMVVEDVLAGNQNPENSVGASWSPTRWDTLSPSDFNDFVSAWEHRDARGPGEGHVNRPHPSAETVTEAAIRHGRKHDPDRTIVHYIQPHYPYYAAAESNGRDAPNSWERYPFPKLMTGQISRHKVWEVYIRELKSVVKSIGVLLDNFNADRVAVTADHGEAFGEWLGYKHRGGTLHPMVRQVPWIVTTATDTHSHEPELDIKETEMEREEMLEALGYM